MATPTFDYHDCAICHARFDAEHQPALYEDGLAYCSGCAYEINMVQPPIAA